MDTEKLIKMFEGLGVAARHQSTMVECSTTGLRAVCLHDAAWRGQGALPVESIVQVIEDLPEPADGFEWVLWMTAPQGFRDKGMLVFCEANSETGAMPPVFKMGA